MIIFSTRLGFYCNIQECLFYFSLQNPPKIFTVDRYFKYIRIVAISDSSSSNDDDDDDGDYDDDNKTITIMARCKH